MLFKSVKLLPTMIMGVFVSKKKYLIVDCVVVILTYSGLVTFLIGNQETKSQESHTKHETNALLTLTDFDTEFDICPLAG
jgi:hypothetical protein